MIDAYLMSQGRHVGDQPAMTTPPQRLTAHDGHLVRLGGGEQIRHPSCEFLASGVGRVRAKCRLRPPGVDHVDAGREMSSTAEPLLPSIFDPRRWQPLFQGLPSYVGVTPTARVAAYVDQHFDSRVYEKPLECDPIQRPVADGQQTRHLSIMPQSVGRIRAANSCDSVGMKGEPVRLAELLAALSLATDLGMGQPSGHAVQTCVLSVQLARRPPKHP